MKNILFIHSSSELYGSDKSLLYLVKNIDKQKYGVYILLPEDGPLVDEIKKLDGVTILINSIAVLRRKNLSIRGLVTYWKDFKKSYRYIIESIKKYKIDIVYTNTSVVFPGAIAAKRMKRKSVWHIREIIDNPKERYFIKWIVNKFSNIIISNSKATGNSICKDESKLRVVYNSVGDVSPKVSNQADRKNITIGMAGRINRWKGQKFFIDASEIILQKKSDVKFKIAGAAYSGEEYLEAELVEYIKEKNLENSIELLGQVENMDDFYDAIDIFVLPSIKPEPFGLVIIEAMERGIPVVATNHGGPVEIIDDKTNGFLVDYENSQQLAESCYQLIVNEHLRKTMGKKGKLKKRQVFSLKNTVNSIEKILEKL